MCTIKWYNFGDFMSSSVSFTLKALSAPSIFYLEFDGPNEKIRYHQSKLVIPESETEYGFLRLHIPLYRDILQYYQPGIIVA